MSVVNIREVLMRVRRRFVTMRMGVWTRAFTKEALAPNRGAAANAGLADRIDMGTGDCLGLRDYLGKPSVLSTNILYFT
jgi:hypothetical protein